MICNDCGRDYPEHLITSMALVVSGLRGEDLCPLCALKERNRARGFPEGKPFWGDTAQRLWEEADEHVRSTSSAR